MNTQRLNINGQAVDITHPDKLLFPADGITKAEFIHYYRQIAPRMLPYLRERPLAMERYQDGIGARGFFQQNLPDYAPAWLDSVTVPKEGGVVRHLVCNSAAALVYLANQDCITPHVWLSRRPHLDKPDQMIFDLDPPADDFAVVREGARRLGSLLDEIGLKAFLKSTGSRGLHVIIPLRPAEDFESVRALAAGIAELLVKRAPERFTTEPRIESRGGRLFLDTLRNSTAHLAVAPYAVRARPGAPVAVPISWQELDDRDFTARSYNLHNIFQRLQSGPDPWREFCRSRQSLALPRRRVESLAAATAGR